jgi:hypothetical protein
VTVYPCPVGSAFPAGAGVPDPDVAATVRVLHRRQGWGRVAVTSILAFLLALGISGQAQSDGTPSPAWFTDLTIGLAVLVLVGVVAAVVSSVQLRRRPAAIRTQAAAIADRHPGGRKAHHYPPRHAVTWILRWIGMLVIFGLAVVCVPALVDGTAYLAGAGSTVTFDPVSHQTNCTTYGCATVTDGILETGGAGVSASWQTVVPLGRPFQIRAPVWRWGLGLSLINSDGTAITAIAISLLIDGSAVLVLISIVRLARNWRRHRRRQAAVPVASAA